MGWIPLEIVGKLLLALGAGLMAVGGLLWLASHFGLFPGGLPGDIRFEGKRTSFYFPLGACLVASIVLTLVLNVIFRLFR